MFSMGTSRDRFVIFDLFSYADGEKTAAEEDLLIQICKKTGINERDRTGIEEYCENAVEKELEADKESAGFNAKDYSNQVIRIMTNILEGNSSYADDIVSFGLTQMSFYSVYEDESEQTRIIWNLLNLGYADKEYSKPEKKIVDFLCKTWNMNSYLKKELEDSIETLESLYEQKEWFESCEGKDEEIREELEAIETDIARVSDSVELTFQTLDRFRNDKKCYNRLFDNSKK